MAATMHDLLTLMIERGASDLHITTGAKPMIRLSGSLVALDTPPVTLERVYGAVLVVVALVLLVV